MGVCLPRVSRQDKEFLRIMNWRASEITQNCTDVYNTAKQDFTTFGKLSQQLFFIFWWGNHARILHMSLAYEEPCHMRLSCGSSDWFQPPFKGNSLWLHVSAANIGSWGCCQLSTQQSGTASVIMWTCMNTSFSLTLHLNITVCKLLYLRLGGAVSPSSVLQPQMQTTPVSTGGLQSKQDFTWTVLPLCCCYF